MQRLQYSTGDESDCIANQQFQLFCRWVRSDTVSQTDSQNTLPSVLTEIKSDLCERAENFSLSEMHSDLCFMPLNKSRHHRIVPEIHIASSFLKEQHFTLLMRDIIHHSSVFIYSFTLFKVESVPSYTLRKRYVIKRIALRYFALQEISSNVFSDEVRLEIQIFQQELWATSHNGWNLWVNSVWHLKFHLLWRKKKKTKKTFSKFSQCLSMSKYIY